jgi:hypothetical protein
VRTSPLISTKHEVVINIILEFQIHVTASQILKRQVRNPSPRYNKMCEILLFNKWFNSPRFSVHSEMNVGTMKSWYLFNKREQTAWTWTAICVKEQAIVLWWFIVSTLGLLRNASARLCSVPFSKNIRI